MQSAGRCHGGFASESHLGELKVLARAEAAAVEPEVVTDVEPHGGAMPIPRVFSSDFPGPSWAMVPPLLEVYPWR